MKYGKEYSIFVTSSTQKQIEEEAKKARMPEEAFISDALFKFFVLQKYEEEE